MYVTTYSNSFPSKNYSYTYCSTVIAIVVTVLVSLTPIMLKSSDMLLQSGSTPLHAAANAWSSDEQVMETLIKAGADVNATDKVCYYIILVS